MTSTSTSRSKVTPVVLAAACWSLLFALQSLFAAITVTIGHPVGADTFGVDLANMARAGDSGLIVILWIAAAAKAAGAPLAVGTVRPWGQRLKRPLRVVCVVGGFLVLGYGVANLVEHGLMAAGSIAVPAGLDTEALPWHLWLWDPYWMLGGALFVAVGFGHWERACPVGTRCQQDHTLRRPY